MSSLTPYRSTFICKCYVAITEHWNQFFSRNHSSKGLVVSSEYSVLKKTFTQRSNFEARPKEGMRGPSPSASSPRDGRGDDLPADAHKRGRLEAGRTNIREVC